MKKDVLNKTTTTHHALPKNKQRVFIAVTLIGLLIVLAAVELCLRLFHYGPHLSLFTTDIVNGTPSYTLNPEIGKKYFYQLEFLPETSPDYFAMSKPEGTYRIFCLGASTTAGYPYWYNGAFSTFMRDRIHALFPDKQLEIINLGLTATNSFTVLDMARELPNYQPDLIITYDGHNEFYGAFGAASRESLVSSRWTVHLYVRLLHIRTFLVVRDMVTNIISLFTKTEGHEERGTTMERLARDKYIPYKSQTYNDALETFNENILELKEICRQNNIPLILSSQVSNVRGQYPFISGDLPVTEELQKNFKQKFSHAQTLLSNNHADSAIILFQQLLSYDSLRADIHYFIGRCFDVSNRKQNANIEYEKARDFDQLRFRASTDFNRVIRNSCNGKNVFFVDIEQTFRDYSLDSLIGNELIFEHLHPTSLGYFIMAKAYVDALREYTLLASATEWKSVPPLNEETLWQQRRITELDERLAARKIEILTGAWPFTQKSVPLVSEVAQNDTLGIIIESTLRNKGNWLKAHLSAADYYLRRDEKELAAKEYEVIINMVPMNQNIYFKLGQIYLDLGKLEKVKQLMLSSLKIKKTIVAYRILGNIALQERRPLEAISYYELMALFDQTFEERLENGYNLALAHAQAGDTERARKQLLSLIKLKPDFQPALRLMSALKKK